MATGFIFLQNGGFTLFPISGTPASRTKGDIWVDDADGLFIVYDGSSNRKMVATDGAQTLSSKTLSNTIFTGTVTGLVKADVGLGNVDNTSDATKNAAAVVLTNKTIDGDDNTVQDLPITALKTNITDASKFMVRDASGVATSATKAVPTGIVVGTTDSQTLTNKTLTTPIISSISNTGTLTLPTSTDTLVGRATTDTLTNKTLTLPVISTISNTGVLTLPTSTDTLVGKATTDTLTNKTLGAAIIDDYADFDEQVSVSSPSAGRQRLFFKNDEILYSKNSSGTEVAYSGTNTDQLTKAWLNLALSVLSGTYSRTGTLVTVTITSHGMATGYFANVSITSGSATTGYYEITRIDDNTFTFNDMASGSTSGNINRNLFVRNSYNISECTYSGVGTFLVEFTSAFSNANYCVSGSVQPVDTNSYILNIEYLTAPTASSCKLEVSSHSSTPTDCPIVTVIFNGN